MDKVTLPSLTPRTLKRGLVALFVLLSILQMASLFKHRDPAPLPDVARPSTLLSPSSPDIPNDFSLFGVAPEEADASARKAERPDALPLTSLRLALTGVLLSEDAAHSIAIFSKDNQQFSCSTNESLPYDDAKLVEIHADSVTLLYQAVTRFCDCTNNPAAKRRRPTRPPYSSSSLGPHLRLATTLSSRR
ncbi:hypothetical protein AU493_16195 [Lonsdalea populi]|nr:hypothetical protein AU493_16195 [Lonsdalea populi]RAT47283.1 hypothetical protein AU495_01000 [Lonsdalea populi]